MNRSSYNEEIMAIRSYRYRWGEGSWSYLFHRLSGAALIVYLCMHIWVMHYLQDGAAAYDGLMRFMDNPLFRLGEVALLAAILFHSLNGVRLVFMDAMVGMRGYRLTFWLVFFLAAAAVLAGGAAIVFWM